MTIRRLLAAGLLAGVATVAVAQATDPAAADHDALRRLKADMEQAISKRDFAKAGQLLTRPFMATVITQDSFTSMDSLERYFNQLFTRDLLRMKDVRISAEADELSEIMTGTFALTRGSTTEHYELADGRSFDMKGRWTAVSVRQPDGQWKIWGIHSGVDFLDNPVLNAIEGSVVRSGVIGLGVGVLLGALAGWGFTRRRAK